MGGIVEASWGAATAKSGDENSLRVFYQMAEALKPLLAAVPKDTPIIATHCLVGLLAVACGFTKVVNLVIDNHAQWFIVVPGALNLVQGPTNYHRLLRMGVKPEQLKLAGAWAPRDLVVNIEADCAARIKRATAKKPVRLLVPVGGAGAQRTFVTNFVKAQKPLLDAGKVQPAPQRRRPRAHARRLRRRARGDRLRRQVRDGVEQEGARRPRRVAPRRRRAVDGGDALLLPQRLLPGGGDDRHPLARRRRARASRRSSPSTRAPS